MSFNPRSRGGSDAKRRTRPPVSRRFNPRSRGGSDGSAPFPTPQTWVSIHAPAGGATHLDLHVTVNDGVSIHAPAGGATAQHHWVAGLVSVSIHAPAGGATVGGVRGWEGGGYGWGFAKDVFRGLYSMDFKGDFMQWAEGQRARMVGGLCNTPGSQPYDTGPTI